MARYLSFALLAASLASAQISSSCNPLNTTITCPPDPALGTSNTWSMANGTDSISDGSIWNVTNGVVGYGNGAAQFTISQKGQAPTIRSNFYFFWGGASITLKAAKGQGIVSSLTYLSDDLDEIDWEWIGGNNTHVQTNYFGKGNTTVYDRAVWVPVDDPQNKYHNYSINWSSSQLQWIIDGNVVRSLPYAQADGHGDQFPQTPLDVRMGIWAGGDESLGNTNWTVQWAGGPVDYSQMPFTMDVQSVTVNDGTTGVSEYTYGDKTGSWKSIKTVAGNSTVMNELDAPPEQSLTQKFDSMSTTAKIGIACGLGAAVLLLGIICTVCCVRRRKEGRRERDAADADWDKANGEMLAYREQMAAGGFSQSNKETYGYGMKEFGSSHPDSLPSTPGAEHASMYNPPPPAYNSQSGMHSPNPQYAAQHQRSQFDYPQQYRY